MIFWMVSEIEKNRRFLLLFECSMMMDHAVVIPIDVYESPTEMVLVMPLWWTKKKSVKLSCSGNILHIVWERKKPSLKDALVALQEECFWWTFKKEITLPDNAAFDRIHSELSKDNILTVIVPRIVVPEEIVVEVK